MFLRLWFTGGDWSALNAIVFVKNMAMHNTHSHTHTCVCMHSETASLGVGLHNRLVNPAPISGVSSISRLNTDYCFDTVCGQSRAIITAWKASVAALLMSSYRQQLNKGFTRHQSTKMLLLTHMPE